MTQSELISTLSARTGIPKGAVGDVLGQLGEVGQREMGTDGGELPLPGLGKLKAATRAARDGHNPATGEAIQIPAKRAVKFVPAKALKEALK